MPPAVTGETTPAASPRQQDAVAQPRTNRAATGNQARADAVGLAGPGKADDRGDPVEKGRQIRWPGAPAQASGQSYLDAAGRLRDPADVTGRPVPADEAMQRIRTLQAGTVVFVFHALQEIAHASQAEVRGHARTRAVGADQMAALANPGQMPAVRARLRLAECTTQAQIDAGPHRLIAEPAHQRGCVGGVEAITGRGQLDAFQ